MAELIIIQNAPSGANEIEGGILMSEQTFELGRWSLADLLPASKGPELEAVLGQLEAAVSELENRRSQLSPDISEQEFRDLMALVESTYELATRLGAYGILWYSEDTQQQDALAFRGRMEKILTQAQSRNL